VRKFRKIRCLECDTEFSTSKTFQKYCSRLCQMNYFDKISGRTCTGLGLPSSTVGAISELRVACDLLEKKYEVFRAISAACSCDLAVLKNGKLLRIEVK